MGPGRSWPLFTRRDVAARGKSRSYKGLTVEKVEGIEMRYTEPRSREQLRPRSNRTFNRTAKQTLGLEVADRAVEFFIRPRKMRDWTFSWTRLPPKRKKKKTTHSLKGRDAGAPTTLDIVVSKIRKGEMAVGGSRESVHGHSHLSASCWR